MSKLGGSPNTSCILFAPEQEDSIPLSLKRQPNDRGTKNENHTRLALVNQLRFSSLQRYVYIHSRMAQAQLGPHFSDFSHRLNNKAWLTPGLSSRAPFPRPQSALRAPHLAQNRSGLSMSTFQSVDLTRRSHGEDPLGFYVQAHRPLGCAHHLGPALEEALIPNASMVRNCAKWLPEGVSKPVSKSASVREHIPIDPQRAPWILSSSPLGFNQRTPWGGVCPYHPPLSRDHAHPRINRIANTQTPSRPLSQRTTQWQSPQDRVPFVLPPSSRAIRTRKKHSEIAHVTSRSFRVIEVLSILMGRYFLTWMPTWPESERKEEFVNICIH